MSDEQQMWEAAWRARVEQEARHSGELLRERRELEARLDAVSGELGAMEQGKLGGRWGQLENLAQLGWLRQQPRPRQALLSHQGACVLPLSKVGFFVGEGGVGKSWALCQLAVSVASGASWLQTFEVAPEGQGDVLLAMAEEDTEELHRRLHQVCGALELSAGQLADVEARIWPMALAGKFVEFLDEGAPSHSHAQFVEALGKNAPPQGWRLVVLDPASRFMGVDAEKDNAYATRFVQLLERLTTLPGNPTVLCAHHTSKVSRQAGQGGRAAAARGSTALTDGARWQGNIVPHYDAGSQEPLEGMAVFQITKSNYGPDSRRRAPAKANGLRRTGASLRPKRRLQR